jgi:septin family protein
MITKKNRIQNNIEETKINFFDPSKQDRDEQDEQQTNQPDKEILEGKIDPTEWK